MDSNISASLPGSGVLAAQALAMTAAGSSGVVTRHTLLHAPMDLRGTRQAYPDGQMSPMSDTALSRPARRGLAAAAVLAVLGLAGLAAVRSVQPPAERATTARHAGDRSRRALVRLLLPAARLPRRD